MYIESISKRCDSARASAIENGALSFVNDVHVVCGGHAESGVLPGYFFLRPRARQYIAVRFVSVCVCVFLSPFLKMLSVILSCVYGFFYNINYVCTRPREMLYFRYSQLIHDEYLPENNHLKMFMCNCCLFVFIKFNRCEFAKLYH